MSQAMRNGDVGMQDLTPRFGVPHRHFRTIDSTNERAKELAATGAPGGLVVSADEQTAGRGRRGTAWFAPPGSCLLYSALLRQFDAEHAPLLPLAVPLAVCEAAEEVAPIRCQVKWPNDVWIDERKVAGVLVEARPEEGWAVIGVGLNVAIPQNEFPDELRETATSLLPTEAEGGVPAGGAPGVRRALDALNRSLARWAASGSDQVLSAFRARDALCGRGISWDGGLGVAEEIDERGHLVVEKTDGERIALGAGEVHLAIEP
jgi:BirA family biotin operon repressor/biotin-[acetyl-CoA-carboxylase] ligase